MTPPRLLRALVPALLLLQACVPEPPPTAGMGWGGTEAGVRVPVRRGADRAFTFRLGRDALRVWRADATRVGRLLPSPEGWRVVHRDGVERCRIPAEPGAWTLHCHGRAVARIRPGADAGWVLALEGQPEAALTGSDRQATLHYLPEGEAWRAERGEGATVVTLMSPQGEVWTLDSPRVDARVALALALPPAGGAPDEDPDGQLLERAALVWLVHRALLDTPPWARESAADGSTAPPTVGEGSAADGDPLPDEGSVPASPVP
jgi:hypothetical protein